MTVRVCQGAAVHEAQVLFGVDIRCAAIGCSQLVHGVNFFDAVEGQSQHHFA